MSIWKYQYFVDVIDLRSFTKAGKKNYVSQTAISQQILQLEKSVGGRLINRGNGEVTPTQMGKLVYERAQEMLKIDGQLLREIEEMKVSSILRVGIDSSINKVFWKKMQKILDDYYNEDDFRFGKLDYGTGSARLDKNELDIYIGYGLDLKHKNPNIGQILLSESRIGAYMGETSAAQKATESMETVTFEELQEYQRYAAESYPCSMWMPEGADAPDFVRDTKLTGNLETLSLKVEMNKGYTFADSRFFSYCTGRMYYVEGLTQMCGLKLFYRKDCMEKEEFLMDFIEKVKAEV